MANINNLYRGQYKVEKGIETDFSSFWSRYGVDSKNDTIKNVIEAIYTILNQDIKSTTDDNNYNYPILDRIEFGDLCTTIENILDNYLSIEADETKYTPEIVKSQIQAQIIEELVAFRNKTVTEITTEENNTEEQVNEDDNLIQSEFKEQLKKIISNFFKITSGEIKTVKGEKSVDDTTNYDINIENIEKLKEYLQRDKDDDKFRGDKLYKEIKNSEYFEKFIDKFKDKIQIYIKKSNKSFKITDNKNTKQSLDEKTSLNQKDLENNGALKEQDKQSKTKNKRGGSIFSRIDKIVDNVFFRILKKFENETKILSKTKGDKKNQNGGFLKTISKIFNKAFSFVKYILSPISGLFSKTLNLVSFPLRKLLKFFNKNKWIKNIMEVVLKNPASAYAFGFLLGTIWKMIENPLQKYVIKPLYNAINSTWEFFSKDVPEFFTDENGSFQNGLKEIKEFLHKLFDNSGNNFFESFIINIAKICCGPELSDSLKEVLSVIGVGGLNAINALINITTSGSLSFFKGLGPIQKLIMISAYASSSALGSMMEYTDKEETTIQIKQEYRKNKKNVLQTIIPRAFANVKDQESKLKMTMAANRDYENIENELYKLMTIEYTLEDLRKNGVELDYKQILKMFTDEKSDLFGEQVAKEFSSFISESDFNKLGTIGSNEDQIAKLNEFLAVWRRNVEGYQNIFSGADNINLRRIYENEGIQDKGLNFITQSHRGGGFGYFKGNDPFTVAVSGARALSFNTQTELSEHEYQRLKDSGIPTFTTYSNEPGLVIPTHNSLGVGLANYGGKREVKAIDRFSPSNKQKIEKAHSQAMDYIIGGDDEPKSSKPLTPPDYLFKPFSFIEYYNESNPYIDNNQPDDIIQPPDTTSKSVFEEKEDKLAELSSSNSDLEYALTIMNSQQSQINNMIVINNQQNRVRPIEIA